jgi:hypothetical protein
MEIWAALRYRPRLRASRLLVLGSRREDGQALILTAFALVVLIGFAGLLIDGGRLYIAQRKLQQAVDAAALAAGQNLPHSLTAYHSAVLYSAAPTEYNQHPASMSANAPTVTFKCLSSLAPGLPCSTDLDGTGCHPAGSAAPLPAGTTMCNAVSVTETASVSTTLLHLFLPSRFTTVAASSVAAARGGVRHPMDIMVVLDTTASMAAACGQPVLNEDGTQAMSAGQSEKIDCAKDGVRRLLKGLQPCQQRVLGNCGTAPPLDEVGLEVFPALKTPTGFSHSTDTNVTHTDLALELNENGTQCAGNLTAKPAWYTPGATFPGWFFNGNEVGYPAKGTSNGGYLITGGLGNDFKLSNFSTTLNPASGIARAVTWDACSGGTIPTHNGTPSSYYGANSAGGAGTYYAGAISVAQAVLASDSSRHAQPVIILLSDGDANKAPDGPNPCQQGIAAAQAAAQAGTWVYSIAYDSSTTSGCALDTPTISPFTAMQQMARNSLNPNVPDPSRFYCVPTAQCPAGNTSDTLAQVFTSIGVDLTDSRLLPDSTP